MFLTPNILFCPINSANDLLRYSYTPSLTIWSFGLRKPNPALLVNPAVFGLLPRSSFTDQRIVDGRGLICWLS